LLPGLHPPQTKRKTSILPKQVLLHFPGPYTDSDAQSIAADGAAAEQSVSAAQTTPAAAGAAQPATPLADAWEMAGERTALIQARRACMRLLGRPASLSLIPDLCLPCLMPHARAVHCLAPA
jgi:hypothetical protein